MHLSRSTIVVSVFSTLALLAAACGDDTGGSGGGGTGGSGSGGDQSTTTTSATTTSTGGSGSVCEQAADFVVAKSSELSCSAVDRAEFIDECESDMAAAPNCADELDASYLCIIDLPSSSWSCDPADDALVAADGSCTTEAQAVFGCGAG